MKKIVFILIALASVFAAHSQTVNMLATNSLTRDTVSNTGSESWSVRTTSRFTNVSVQVDFTKISGTLGGTATLYGSLNGTAWATIGVTAYTVTDVAAQSVIFNVSGGKKYPYYRVTWVGTGTMSGSARAYLFAE